MKPYLSIAIWMALSSIVFKLIILALGIEIQSRVMYVAFFNLLVISIGTFFGIRKFKILNPSIRSFKEDVKAGMRISAVYALLIALFVLLYYKYIDAHAFESMIDVRLENAAKMVEEGAEVDLVAHESLTRFIFSAKTHASVTLFGFLVAGTIYSLLISYFMRKFPGFK